MYIYIYEHTYVYMAFGRWLPVDLESYPVRVKNCPAAWGPNSVTISLGKHLSKAAYNPPTLLSHAVPSLHCWVCGVLHASALQMVQQECSMSRTVKPMVYIVRAYVFMARNIKAGSVSEIPGD